MVDFSKQELETMLKDTEEHLAETMRLGPGYYRIRERYDYAIESDERYIEKLEKQIAEFDQDKLNESQQVVLEWLKEQVSNGETLQYILWELTDNAYEEPAMGILSAHTKAWLELEEDEQFQLLAAFAEWGMEEAAE